MADSRKTHTLGVRLDDDAMEKLRELALGSGRTRSSVIRRLIKLAKHGSVPEFQLLYREDAGTREEGQADG